jgi:hypothetical protein
MTSEIKVEGLNRLVRQLGKLDADLKPELKAINKDLADDLVPVAKSKVPVRSGRLKASIRAGATNRSGVVRAGKKKVPYAGPIHFGWPARRIAPQPFLWEAMDSRRGEIQRQYVERVSDLVKKVR